MQCVICKEHKAEVIQPITVIIPFKTTGRLLYLCARCFDRYTFEIEDGQINIKERG